MKNIIHNNTAGLTLIEVLVSIAMLALLIGLVMPSLLMNQKVNRDSRAEQNMAAYAKASMEIAKQGILTKTTSATDPYPYLTAGTLPTLTYPTPNTGAGWSCGSPQVAPPVTYKVRNVTLGSRVTITISCTVAGKKDPIPFVEQVVRPV